MKGYSPLEKFCSLALSFMVALIAFMWILSFVWLIFMEALMSSL